MLILRIRQAEVALADGRLDEAYGLVQDGDVALHRLGQRLIGRLMRAFVKRGEAHLAAGRLDEAMADCQRGRRLGGNVPEVAQLNAAVLEAVLKRQRSQRRRAGALAAAREHINHGRLSLGQELLATMDADSERVEILHHEAAAQRARVEGALQQADAALAREDWSGAVRQLEAIRRVAEADARFNELCARLAETTLSKVRVALDAGRLDQAETLLRHLASLAQGNDAMLELSRVVRHCRAAAEWIEGGQPAKAHEALSQIRAMLPGAAWLTEAIDAAEHAARHFNVLLTGPLGLLSLAQTTGEDEQTPPGVAAGRPAAAPRPRPLEQAVNVNATTLPAQFLIQVDGVGSYLVMRQASVTVGSISSSGRPDLGVIAEPNCPPATIERVDDDYFLRSRQPVSVNGSAATSKLLVDGDKLSLSPRCRFKFTLPNAASTSAVLDLSGARLPRADVRKVVLLDEAIVVGPGPSAHVRADGLGAPAVLQVRNGRLYCRSDEALTIDGQAAEAATAIPLGKPVRIGSVGLVVTTV